MNRECEIVQDLLPLYWDNVCSESTALMVKDHLVTCAACREVLHRLEAAPEAARLQSERDEIISHHNKIVKRKALTIGISIGAVLSLPVLITFIVNLAVGKTLDWFFIVLMSLLVVASVTVVPLVAETRKAFWTILAFTASVLALLLCCSIYTGGDWFLVTAVSVLLGLSLFFTPIVLRQFPGKGNFICGKIGLLSMLIDTALLYGLIIISMLYAGAAASLASALLLTTYCVLPAWLIFLVIRYTRLHPLTKSGIIVILLGLFTVFSNDWVTWILEKTLSIAILQANLSMWSEATLDANIKLITLISLLVIGLVLLLIGIAYQRKNKHLTNLTQ